VAAGGDGAIGDPWGSITRSCSAACQVGDHRWAIFLVVHLLTCGFVPGRFVIEGILPVHRTG